MYRTIRPFKKDWPSGLKLVGARLPKSPVVSLSFWVGWGSRFERQDQKGYSHFLEHMLFRGTKNRTAFDIARSVDRLGGQMNAATSREYTYYYISLIYTQAEFAFDLLSDMLFNARLAKSELEKEKQVVLEEISMNYDSPEDYIYDMFVETAFSRDALGKNILGTQASIRRCEPRRLRSFLTSGYRPDNTLISVAGNIEPKLAERFSAKYFGKPARLAAAQGKGGAKRNGRRGEEAMIMHSPPRFHGGRRHLDRDLKQVHFCLGFPGLPVDDPRREAMFAFDNIIGATMSSVLFQRLREDMGLCYHVESFYYTYADTGLYGFYAATSTRNFRKAVKEIKTVLENFRTDYLTEKELDESKDSMIGRLALGMDSSESVMTELAWQELYTGRYESLAERIKRIRSVTVHEVAAFVDEMLSYSPLLVSVGRLSPGAADYNPF